MERVELLKSVPNVPTHEEYNGLDDNYIEDEEFEAENKDDKIKKMLAIMLALLQEFYILHMYDAEYYFASEQFQIDIEQFNEELKANLMVLFTNYFTELTDELDIKWRIPTDTVDIVIDLEELVNSGMDTVAWSLFFDLKDKADYYKVTQTSGKFVPHVNFRRALRRLTNQIDFKAQSIKKQIDRNYLEFVYGQEALFYWKCSGINTCAWCYDIEAMGAMPLSWFPVDHVNGRCELVPVLPDVYSDDYLEVRRD